MILTCQTSLLYIYTLDVISTLLLGNRIGKDFYNALPNLETLTGTNSSLKVYLFYHDSIRHIGQIERTNNNGLQF